MMTHDVDQPAIADKLSEERVRAEAKAQGYQIRREDTGFGLWRLDQWGGRHWVYGSLGSLEQVSAYLALDKVGKERFQDIRQLRADRRMAEKARHRISIRFADDDEELQADVRPIQEALDRAVGAWRQRELARIDADLRELGAEPEAEAA